ncbi:hypothetical protein LCGC14_2811060 [marine sediment metagenome]|uniref:HNH endonuclease n=1 Tax=marine sediment metagenome TaxID=412755 RepID=A0A0F9BB70_9ZZZZ
MKTCVTCKTAPRETQNKKCRSCHAAYQREWNRKHPERFRETGRRYYRNHRDKVLARAAIRRSQLRIAAFEHYGFVCLCCGETEDAFLTIDHIVRPDKKTNYEKKALYQLLKAKNYPAGFQTLCCNCNMAKGIYGLCPHQAERMVSAYYDVAVA